MTLDFVEIHQCPACMAGVSQWTDLAVGDRYRLPVRWKLCHKCGLVFANPRLTDSDFGWLYRSGTYRQLVTEATGADQSVQAVAACQENYGQWVAQTFRNVLTEHGAGGSVLDVGGGTGDLCRVICDEVGATGVVLDPAVDELARAEENGLSTICGTVESTELAPHDVVLLMQTLDHCPRPAETLCRLRTVTKKLLIVDSVDFPALFVAHAQGKTQTERAMKLDHPTNLFPELTRALLLRAGFEVLQQIDRPGKHAQIFVCAPSDRQCLDARPAPGFLHHLIRNVYQNHTFIGRYPRQPQ